MSVLYTTNAQNAPANGLDLLRQRPTPSYARYMHMQYEEKFSLFEIQGGIVKVVNNSYPSMSFHQYHISCHQPSSPPHP